MKFDHHLFSKKASSITVCSISDNSKYSSILSIQLLKVGDHMLWKLYVYSSCLLRFLISDILFSTPHYFDHGQDRPAQIANAYF